MQGARFPRPGPLTWAAAVVLAAGLTGACSDAGRTERGWLITVYYTAVESFHDRSVMVDVVGCPELDCTRGDTPLGRYPEPFVTAVKDEGSGRITSGEHAGRYLNWASSEGYWLDDAPRDQAGRPLEPYRSAAADDLDDGTRIAVVECGRGLDGSPPVTAVCRALREARWEIRDAFTPGFGGSRHVDLYLGEEDRPDFVRSEVFTSFRDATLEIRP